MKFGKRLGLVAAIVALSLAPVIGSLAQGMMTCTLSAADCQTLATANANVAKETSYAFSLEFNLDIKGDSPVAAQATGTGQLAVAPSANMSDPTAAAKAIQFQLDVNGSATAPSANQGTFSVVVTGGVAYFKGGGQDWQGINLSDAIKMGQAQAAGGGGFGSMTGGVNPAQLQQMFGSADFVNAIKSLGNIKGFISQAKTSNTPQLEGQNMSEYVDTFTPAVLFTSPDFATALKAIMSAAMAANPSAGAASGMNADQMTAMLPMFGSMLNDTNLKLTLWVGQQDNMYHALGLDLTLNVNTSAMGGSGSPTTGTIHFLVKLSKIGQPVSVTAPTGAKMIDLSGMMGGMSGGGVMPGGATPTASS